MIAASVADVVLATVLLFFIPFGCIVVSTVDELVMPVVRRRVRAWRRRRRAMGRRVSW